MGHTTSPEFDRSSEPNDPVLRRFGRWVRINAGFDQGFYRSSRAFPRWWRWALTWVLGAGLVFFCYFGWWSHFEFIRGPFAYIIAALAAVGSIGTALHHWWFGRKEPPESEPQPGGIFYVLFILLMLLWWTISTYSAGTHQSLFPPFDPTLGTQFALGTWAIVLVTARPQRTIVINIHWRRWIASYLVFFLAILMMIADTDYQYNVTTAPIEWELWIRWRCLNYGLIIPYLTAGIAVIHGWSLARLCAMGAVAVPCLAIAVTVSGVPM